MTNPAHQAADRIAKALEAGPTPGEWHDCGGLTPEYGALTSSEGYIVYGYANANVHQEHGKPIKAPSMVRQFANRKYIAACSPDNLRALLAERDEMAKDAARWHAVRDATGDAVASAKFAITAAVSAEEADRIADSIAALTIKEQE